MKPRNLLVGLLTTVSLTAAFADDARDRAMIERSAQRQAATPAAAAKPAPPAESAATTDLRAQVQQAESDLIVAQARVDLIQARKLYRAGDITNAAAKARAVLAALAKLPADVDASQYELQAEGILAKANHSESPAPRATQPPTMSDGAQVSDQVATVRQAPGDYGYSPGLPALDAQEIRRADRARTDYDAALWQAYSAYEADQLVDADTARLGPAPGEWVQYPPNWPDIVKKREKYKDGAIAKSNRFRDKDGREWYVAIYDVNDLTYVPPDFQPARGLTPDEELRNQLDRDALRYRSDIFNGYANELAAGIPLLRFFGGVDDFAFRGAKFSAEKQREIVEMVRAFTAAQTFEPRVESIGP